jgi:hypothetical protein
MDEKVPVGNEKFQFAHEPKAEREQESDGEDEGVGNHLNA